MQTFLLSLRSWFRCSAILTVAGLAACSSLEARFYQPDARDYSAPAGVEEHFATAQDGASLQTWFLAAPSLRNGRIERAPLLVFSPGSRTQIDELLPMLQPIAERADVSLMLFNYRSYGRSTGNTSVSRRSTLLDLRAAYALAMSRPDVDPTRTVLMGYSLGAVPTLALASTNSDVAAVVVGGVYARTGDLLDDEGYGLLTWLIGSHLDPEDSAEGLSGRPVFLFHGEEDADVPPYHALELGSALLRAGARLELHLVPDANHRNVLTPESELAGDLVQFLREVLHAESPIDR